MVNFNGTKAEILEVTPNKITVASPEGITSGKISVAVNGTSTESAEVYTANLIVVEGKITSSITWTANYQYLLIGKVEVITGTVLTIEPGTIIKGDKKSMGRLLVNGKIIAQGTFDKPIVFTSNQEKGARDYGDWGGIEINGLTDVGNSQHLNDNSGTLTYVRIEFAGGYVGLGNRYDGLALHKVGKGTKLENIQVSFCGGKAYNWASGNVNAKYLISFRTYDHDFSETTYYPGDGSIFNNFSGNVQYALALRDPYIAPGTQADCISSSGGGTALFSNFTCVGGQLLTRAAAIPILGDIIIQTGNPGNGRGVHIANSSISVYNSVFVGSWLAGLSLEGYYSILDFENIPRGVPHEFRDNFFAGTAPALSNVRGGTFSFENVSAKVSGFETAGTTQMDAFTTYRNQEFQMNLQPNPGQPVFDELVLSGLTTFSKITAPDVLPGAGSPLLGAAHFTIDSKAGNEPFFDKTVTFAGAFGTEDWTKGWANWDPQFADY